MKIAIFGRITDNTDRETLTRFFSYLQERQVQFSLFERYHEQLTERYPLLLEGKKYGIFFSRW